MTKHERGFDERSSDTTSRSVQEAKGWKESDASRATPAGSGLLQRTT